MNALWRVRIACVLLVASGACTASEERAAFRPLAVGDTVPHYVASTLNGDTVRVGGAGPLTLVNVWATWCTSCREEMADLESIHRDYAPRGLRVFAVSVDAGSRAKVERFAESERLTFLIAHDPASVIQRLYSVVGVPETFLVARDGRILWQQRGGLHGSADIARTQIDRALGH